MTYLSKNTEDSTQLSPPVYELKDVSSCSNAPLPPSPPQLPLYRPRSATAPPALRDPIDETPVHKRRDLNPLAGWRLLLGTFLAGLPYFIGLLLSLYPVIALRLKDVPIDFWGEDRVYM